MAIVGPIVRYDTHIFLIALALAIAFVALASRPRTPLPAEEGPRVAEDEHPAAVRLARAEAQRERRGRIGALGTGLAVVLLLAMGIAAQPGPPPKAQAAATTVGPDGRIALDAAPLEDGKLHFFSVADPKTPASALRFFVIQKPDGALQACMDACEICGDLGYYQDGAGVTCRNCSAPINLTTLGETGGCNPIPIASRREGASLVVDASSIYAQRVVAKGKD
jgi:uncharacterized membrane protein